MKKVSSRYSREVNKWKYGKITVCTMLTVLLALMLVANASACKIRDTNFIFFINNVAARSESAAILSREQRINLILTR